MTLAHAGADVRGAGGQVAELLAEGVIHLAFKMVIEAIDVLPGFVERKAAAHHLEP